MAALIFVVTSPFGSACAGPANNNRAIGATKRKTLMATVITKKSVFCNHELDAAVLRPTSLGPVIGNRHILAVSLRNHAVRVDPALDHVDPHTFGTLLAELQVKGVIPDGVGVTLDFHLDLGVVGHGLGDLV